MARKTTTKTYAKSLARSGPELQPSQIRLADEAQTDKDKVYTQTDVNQGMGSGGGGADLTGYAKTDYVDSADNALNDLLATETQARKDGDAAASYQLQQAEIGLEAKIEANTAAIEAIEIPESGGGGEPQTLESVLAAGNEAGPGQSIRMHLDESDLENIQQEIEANIGSLSGGKQREAINIEGRSGLRLGAAVSTYTFNEPFTVDLDEGEVSLFQACHRKMTAAGDLFTGGTSEGSYTEAKFGIGGFSYWSDFCVNINIHNYGYTVDCKNDAGEESLKIHWHRSSNRSYVKANEFIGDGSKLTNLPVDEATREQLNTNTAELNAANSRISGNSKEIEGLQSGFDAALLAAQEGSENLTIELQSYTKKEDAATKDELAFVDCQYKLADENILKASQEADTALGELISDLQEGLEGHTHNGYASSSHAHTGTYVKGNYTISKVNGNYYIS